MPIFAHCYLERVSGCVCGKVRGFDGSKGLGLAKLLISGQEIDLPFSPKINSEFAPDLFPNSRARPLSRSQKRAELSGTQKSL